MMKNMRKMIWIIAAVVAVIVLLGIVLLVLRGNEDSWIQDDRGIWVKHGNPAEIPKYVVNQYAVMFCSANLYFDEKDKGTNFSSQCLGTCGNYAVDIVHVPRTAEDNLKENQCKNYTEGKVHYFIELDGNGRIVRIS